MGNLGDQLGAEPAPELLASALVASLATLNRDGSAHVVPVWFNWDGEAILIPTHDSGRKYHNLERDPRATVMVDVRGGGFNICGVTLRGVAQIVRGPEALELNRAVHLKYVTEQELALEPVHRSLSNEVVTIRIVPAQAMSWDFRKIDQEVRRLSEA